MINIQRLIIKPEINNLHYSNKIGSGVKAFIDIKKRIVSTFAL